MNVTHDYHQDMPATMNCDKVLKNLYKLLEEDPSTPFCQSLRKHLEACESCAQYHKELKDVIELCRSFPKEPISEDYKEELRRFLLRELQKREAT